jgi:DNA-binding CsgD family transcriptional regulator
MIAAVKVDHQIRLHALERVASGLDFLPLMAFLTDRQNRIIWVNRTFARTIGDPLRDNVPAASRFVPAAVAGPYRDHFPRWKLEISQCLAGLYREVDRGNLESATLALIERTLDADEELKRAAIRTGRDWDGTMIVKDECGKMTMVREQVLPIEDADSRATGFHVSLWLPEHDGDRPGVAGARALLTPRQLEIARLYASGMGAEDVAAAAGISWRTARDHLEEIYQRLGVHSRAELASRLAHEGLV